MKFQARLLPTQAALPEFPGEGECSDARAIAKQGLLYKNPFAMNPMQQSAGRVKM